MQQAAGHCVQYRPGSLPVPGRGVNQSPLRSECQRLFIQLVAVWNLYVLSCLMTFQLSLCNGNFTLALTIHFKNRLFLIFSLQGC